jgi:hypothetical protein
MWEDHFRTAGVLVEELDRVRSAQARATILGNFLSQNQCREVAIKAGDRSGRARLCVAGGDGKPRRYYFAIAWDDDSNTDPSDISSATGPTALDDGLGHPVTVEPGAAPPVPLASPHDDDVPVPARSEGGHIPPDREAAANLEDWSGSGSGPGSDRPGATLTPSETQG